MHLLVRERGSIDEDEPALDLGLAPADVLFLSFSDSDLAAIRAAERPDGLRLATANVGQLRHPLSVDLLVARTVPGSGIVVARLLGGLDYWRYGAEELAAACREAAVPAVFLTGDGRDDDRLEALSTVPPCARTRLDAMLRGGAGNAARALRLARALARGADTDEAPAPVAASRIVPALARAGGGAGRVAIVLYRSHLLAGDTDAHAALADALAARGLAVGAIAVASPKSPCGSAFLRAAFAGGPPDLVLNATAFSSRDRAGTSPLASAGIPVLQLVLAGTSRSEWAASARGLSPADLAMLVVLPELDGTIATAAIAHKEDTSAGARRFVPHEDGIALAADRAAALVRLGRLPRAARRIAIVLSDYPGAAGHRHGTGHAVGLDTFASLAVILALLRDGGFSTGEGDLPDAAGLARSLAAGDTRRFGLVTVALQPDRGRADDSGADGSGADRRSAYHDPDAAPSDAYERFYGALAADADAIVHLGTHGTLEWLPGKAVALSRACDPARLVRHLPVIAPFIVNNPGEAAVARRRIGAVTIGHLTPPLVPARLGDDARRVERLLDEYAEADGLDRARTMRLRAAILDAAAAAGLLDEAGCGAAGAVGADDGAASRDTDRLARLDAFLCDIKELRVGDGLHVFGVAPPRPDATLDPAALARSPAAERAALLAALDARFVAPGPGGAPSIGRADVLPTGRNLSSIDPRAIPAPSAIALARRQADQLLRRHAQEQGEPLRTLVLDLWGSASIRTGGADLALAFILMGVEPTHDRETNRFSGFTITPLAALGRPRVDVTLRISGLFRDNFAHAIALFDQAVRRLAARDESPEDNPLAGSAVRHRVFGPAPGRHGTTESDWLAASAHAYGQDSDGMPAIDALSGLVAGADAFLHVQDHRDTDVLDGPEHLAHEGGFAAAARALGRTPALYHGDISDADAPRIRHLRDEIARVARGRLANPEWLGGMRRHGMRGGAEMARGVEALAGFAAVLPTRLDASLDLVAASILGDRTNVAFLARANPAALDAIRHALAEARAAGHWHPRRNDVP